MLTSNYICYTTTGCCKTSGQLCKLLCDSFLGVFFLFFCSFDCKIWAIFHSGTLWQWRWIFFVENIIMKNARFQGWLRLAHFSWLNFEGCQLWRQLSETFLHQFWKFLCPYCCNSPEFSITFPTSYNWLILKEVVTKNQKNKKLQNMLIWANPEI